MKIKEALQESWQEIAKCYLQGEICSERHLQSELYRLLKNKINAFSFEIYVEPRISCLSDTCINGLIPDILITKEGRLIAVIEIKYVPHYYIDYHKDIETFNKFALLRNTDTKIRLKRNAENGNWDDSNLVSISSNVTFVYFTISNCEAYIVTDTVEIWANFNKNKHQYLHFIGSVGEGNNRFYCFP